MSGTPISSGSEAPGHTWLEQDMLRERISHSESGKAEEVAQQAQSSETAVPASRLKGPGAHGKTLDALENSEWAPPLEWEQVLKDGFLSYYFAAAGA